MLLSMLRLVALRSVTARERDQTSSATPLHSQSAPFATYPSVDDQSDLAVKSGFTGFASGISCNGHSTEPVLCSSTNRQSLTVETCEEA
jgi:hypothetical protein